MRENKTVPRSSHMPIGANPPFVGKRGVRSMGEIIFLCSASTKDFKLSILFKKQKQIHVLPLFNKDKEENNTPINKNV